MYFTSLSPLSDSLSQLQSHFNNTGRENLIITRRRQLEEALLLVECQSHCESGLKVSLRKSWGRSHSSIHGSPLLGLDGAPWSRGAAWWRLVFARDREAPHRDSISAGGREEVGTSAAYLVVVRWTVKIWSFLMHQPFGNHPRYKGIHHGKNCPEFPDFHTANLNCP